MTSTSTDLVRTLRGDMDDQYNSNGFNVTSPSTMVTSATDNTVQDLLTSTVNTTLVPRNNSLDTGTAEQIPLASSVILIILYTLTTIAAVVGNSLAIIVFARGKRCNTDLRLFLINLAVADLIMAIFCIPFTFAYQITENWIFSDLMCPIVQCCQVVSVTASVSTNTAIGIDRLIAVKFPLRKRVTNSKSKLVILFIWIFAISMGIVPLVMSRTTTRNGKVACEEHWSDQHSRLVYSFFIIIITYFLPVTVLSVTYTMIGRQLWKHKLPGNADDHRDAVQLKSKRKVVKMLVTIVLLFGVCWLPLHLFIITITFNHNIFGDAANEIYFGVHWLSMANSFVNPVVYGFMNDNFRADLKCMAESCLCWPWRHQRLKYRPAAMRWRLGDSNVHDASHASHQCYRHSSPMMMDKSPRQHQPLKNGHAHTSPPFDVRDTCTCDVSQDKSEARGGQVSRQDGNGGAGGRKIFIGGKRRRYELCKNENSRPNSMEQEGMLKLKEKPVTSSRSKGLSDSNSDGLPSVFFDGSDAVLLSSNPREYQT